MILTPLLNSILASPEIQIQIPGIYINLHKHCQHLNILNIQYFGNGVPGEFTDLSSRGLGSTKTIWSER